MKWISDFISKYLQHYIGNSNLIDFLSKIEEGVENTNKLYPFMAYGTDWLAFAHLVIAIAAFKSLHYFCTVFKRKDNKNKMVW